MEPVLIPALKVMGIKSKSFNFILLNFLIYKIKTGRIHYLLKYLIVLKFYILKKLLGMAKPNI